jgi:hypothetical protein
MAWQLTHSPHVDHLLGEPWCRKLRRRVAQIKVTDHVVPTVRTSAGHRCCLAGDDQGQPAALHHQLRCGDITATMPKVVDDHLDYGGTLAYLTRCPTNQDGVVIEKLVSNGASLSMQASSSIASRSSGDSAPAGTSDTRKPNRAVDQWHGALEVDLAPYWAAIAGSVAGSYSPPANRRNSSSIPPGAITSRMRSCASPAFQNVCQCRPLPGGPVAPISPHRRPGQADTFEQRFVDRPESG